MENLPPTRHRTLQSQITTPDKRWGQNTAYHDSSWTPFGPLAPARHSSSPIASQFALFC